MPSQYRGKKTARWHKERGAAGYYETKLKPQGAEIIMKPDPVGQELFEIRREFEITTPEDFEGSTYLKSFIKKYRDMLLRVSLGYLLKNFSKKTCSGIEPGTTYKVIIYESLKRNITKADCCGFTQKVKGFNPGAEGIALTYELSQKSLWGVRSLISFNNPKSPMKDEEGKEKAMRFYRHRIPSHRWQLHLIDANDTYGRNKNDCLLVFFKK